MEKAIACLLADATQSGAVFIYLQLVLVVVFGFGSSGHQLCDGLRYAFFFEEYLVYGLGDGHFDVVFLCEFDDAAAGVNAFDFAGDFVECLFW